MLEMPERAARPTGRSRRLSTCCAVLGAACLWAWGYVANISPALLPVPDVTASVGIEFAYYASQLTLFLCGIACVLAVRRWQPALPPAVVVLSALVLAATACAMPAVLSLPAPPLAAIVACGIANGLAGMVLTIAWGARFSLGSPSMRRMVLLSFLVGYAVYLGCLYIPHAAQAVVAPALPVASGALWLFDSWRRHLLTAEVWPSSAPSCADAATDSPVPLRARSHQESGAASLGEAAAGSTSVSILPWRTICLFAVASLVGNVITSFVMGASYAGAEVIFPGAFVVVGCVTLAAVALVGNGSRRLSIERLYRYDLPIAVLGMLAIMVSPDEGLEFSAALVAGAGIFLQALVILKVTETTQETGVSPMLSFAVGQGLIGGVVFAGNAAGRLLSEVAGGAALLEIVCAAGVFVLFYLLVLLANDMADRLVELRGAPVGALSADGDASALRPMSGDDAPSRRAGPAGACAEVSPAPAGLELPLMDTAEAAAFFESFCERHGLTPREVDVFAHLLRGRSLPAIAERLFVTAGTVKTHTLHIYRKAGVASRQELIDLFEREG